MRPIISPNIRVRYPDLFVVGDDSVIDDFCYFSTRIRIGRGSHIAAGCTIGGGVSYEFAMGDFSSLSSGVRVWCKSNDFGRDLVALVPEGAELGDTPVAGDVCLGDYTGVGANTVIMPDNALPEGTAIGALSFVPPRFPFEPWSVYAGIPIRPVASRERARVLDQAERLKGLLDGRR